MQRALVQENRSKEIKDVHRSRSDRPRINTVDCDSENSDEEADIYAAEFVWPSKNKPYTCDALKPIRKNREDEMKFSFDVAKCDRIFDAMLKDKCIRISHTIPPFEELKRRAYCKYHNSFSHATNDCNVFRRQIQSAINDGRLSFADMQIDKQPFPMNTMDLEGKKILIRPNMAESANKNNVVIGEPRNSGKESNKVLGRNIVLGKQPDGRETLKITIKNPAFGGQPQVQEDARVKFIKPKRAEVGRWKINEAKAQPKKIKPTFDMLMSKYANQAAGSNFNRPSHMKRPRSPPRERSP